MNSKQENGDHYDDTVSEYTGSDCSDVEEDTSGVFIKAVFICIIK